MPNWAKWVMILATGFLGGLGGVSQANANAKTKDLLLGGALGTVTALIGGKTDTTKKLQ